MHYDRLFKFLNATAAALKHTRATVIINHVPPSLLVNGRTPSLLVTVKYDDRDVVIFQFTNLHTCHVIDCSSDRFFSIGMPGKLRITSPGKGCGLLNRYRHRVLTHVPAGIRGLEPAHP